MPAPYGVSRPPPCGARWHDTQFVYPSRIMFGVADAVAAKTISSNATRLPAFQGFIIYSFYQLGTAILAAPPFVTVGVSIGRRAGFGSAEFSRARRRRASSTAAPQAVSSPAPCGER